jgi:hypothetical protein
MWTEYSITGFSADRFSVQLSKRLAHQWWNRGRMQQHANELAKLDFTDVL